MKSYRVWYDNGTAILLDAGSDTGARLGAIQSARKNGNPYLKITKLERVDSKEKEVNESRVFHYLKKNGTVPAPVISADLDLSWNEIQTAINGLIKKKLIAAWKNRETIEK